MLWKVHRLSVVHDTFGDQIMPAYFDNGLMVGQSAWHKLGRVIDADDDRRFSVNDCITLADMDQQIVLSDAYYLYGEHCDKIEGQFATLRIYADGTIKALSTVGSKYQPLQPRQTFEFFQSWLDTKEVSIETCGTLRGGKVDWVLARILRDDINTGMDAVAKYLTITTSHDGTEATRVGFTPIRIVCANTLAMAHSDAASKLLRVRHTKGQSNTLATIRETIDLVDQEFIATGEQYAKLMQCGLSLKELRCYVKMVCEVDPDQSEKTLGGRMRKRIDKIVQLALHGKGQDGSMTAWSAYNGVTEMLSHDYAADGEKRLVSMMQGTSALINKRAFALALQLAA